MGAPTNYYVRHTNGVDSAGRGLSHATAYQTEQYAIDDILATHGKGADGDILNICDSALEGVGNIAAGGLSLAAYAPSQTQPFSMRGYTASAGDRGRGALKVVGSPGLFAAAPQYTHLADLDISTTNSGVYDLIAVGRRSSISACSVNCTPSGGGTIRNGIAGTADDITHFLGNYVYGAFSGTGIYVRHSTVVMGNYVVQGYTGAGVTGIGGGNSYNAYFLRNIVILKHAASIGYSCFAYSSFEGNVVYQTTAGTGRGIRSTRFCNHIANNIICGFSGVGGIGINIETGPLYHVNYGPNAFWNCTSNLGSGITTLLSAADVALGADPFTDAANGDFTLTATAQAALRNLGWPGQYLGAHANTNSHITIGAIQYGTGGGGAVSISPWKGMIG